MPEQLHGEADPHRSGPQSDVPLQVTVHDAALMHVTGVQSSLHVTSQWYPVGQVRPLRHSFGWLHVMLHTRPGSQSSQTDGQLIITQ